MNKLFKAKNKNNNFQWVIAENEEQAYEICIKSKFVKNINNYTLYLGDKDTPNFYEYFKNKKNDMTEVDNKIGVGCVYINNVSSVWKVMCV